MNSAYNEALGLLAKRDYSGRALQLALIAKGFSTDEANDSVAKLIAGGLVDDARLAHNTSEKLRGKLRGNLEIASKLELAGLIDVNSEDGDEEFSRGIELLELKLPNEHSVTKIARFLGNRGYSQETIELICNARMEACQGE